jgi:hypothetical protein
MLDPAVSKRCVNISPLSSSAVDLYMEYAFAASSFVPSMRNPCHLWVRPPRPSKNCEPRIRYRLPVEDAMVTTLDEIVMFVPSVPVKPVT